MIHLHGFLQLIAHTHKHTKNSRDIELTSKNTNKTPVLTNKIIVM